MRPHMKNSPSPWLVILCAFVLAVALPARAAPPTRLSDVLDISFKSNLWTARCGFPVHVQEQGMLGALLFHAADGTTVVSEIDTAPDLKITFFSPSSEAGGTGRSYIAASGALLRTLYPDGTGIGATALMYFDGLQLNYPKAPQAGYDAWLGEVVFVTDEGQPVADLVEPMSRHGHFTDLAGIIDALCGELANP